MIGINIRLPSLMRNRSNHRVKEKYSNTLVIFDQKKLDIFNGLRSELKVAKREKDFEGRDARDG